MSGVRTPGVVERTGAAAASLPVVLGGAVLCLAVAAVHVRDQGGLAVLKTPAYIGYGYRAVEIAAVVAAALLLGRRTSAGWFLALGVAAGPLLGYVLSRSTGLPGDAEDVGNWTEPLGLASLFVEGAVIAASLSAYAILPAKAKTTARRLQAVSALPEAA